MMVGVSLQALWQGGVIDGGPGGRDVLTRRWTPRLLSWGVPFIQQ